jgi:hypothetical protein
MTEDASRLVPTAVLGFIFNIEIITGMRMLPRTRPTIPPRIPIPNPITDSYNTIIPIAISK